MANPYSFYQFEDALRGLANTSEDQRWNLAAEDQQWNFVASKLALAEQMRGKSDKNNKADSKRSSGDANHKSTRGKNKTKSEDAKNESVSKLTNADWKSGNAGQKINLLVGANNGTAQTQTTNSLDKRFKSLPPAETLPRHETLGGYIFVCNNDTMQEDLKRQLFGLPQRYRDSVRSIQPGLPLFLYNYTTHQLHGIFEAASFGGSNIDPTAWEDKKCKGESRFPAQVRIRVRKLCKPLEEDSFRPVLHHYDGPKFRLQLSVPETLAILDLCSGSGTS